MQTGRYGHASARGSGTVEQIPEFFRLIGEFQRGIDFLRLDQRLMCFGHPGLPGQDLTEFIVSLGAAWLFPQNLPQEGFSLLVVTRLHGLLDVFGRGKRKDHRGQEGKGTKQKDFEDTVHKRLHGWDPQVESSQRPSESLLP
jgi:hypothetical protein